MVNFIRRWRAARVHVWHAIMQASCCCWRRLLLPALTSAWLITPVPSIATLHTHISMQIIVANPKTAGVARWIFLALWGSKMKKGDAAATEYVTKVSCYFVTFMCKRLHRLIVRRHRKSEVCLSTAERVQPEPSLVSPACCMPKAACLLAAFLTQSFVHPCLPSCAPLNNNNQTTTTTLVGV